MDDQGWNVTLASGTALGIRACRATIFLPIVKSGVTPTIIVGWWNGADI